MTGLDFYEQTLHKAGFARVGGADEAGRGACAGPLVAAAVILGSDVPEGLDDSKRLTPARREALYGEIMASSIAVTIYSVSAAECDRMGVQVADLHALRQAVLALDPEPDFVVTDGFAVSGLPCPSLGMWKADQAMRCVSAASIVAKVTRDKVMVAMAQTYPGYGFDVHKGYATAAHQLAIDALGPCPEHRFSYRNVMQTSLELRQPVE